MFYFFNEDRKENGRFDFAGSGDKTHGKQIESNMDRRKRTIREALEAYNASTDHPSVEDVATGKVSVEEALRKGFEIKFGGQKIIFFTDVLSDHYAGREGRLALVKKAISERNKLMPGRHYDGQTVLMSQKHLQPTEKKLVVIADAETGIARSIMMSQQNYCDSHFKLWGRK